MFRALKGAGLAGSTRAGHAAPRLLEREGRSVRGLDTLYHMLSACGMLVGEGGKLMVKSLRLDLGIDLRNECMPTNISA